MTKPFNLEEILFRVQKLISKNKKLQDKSSVDDTYSFGGHTIDFKAQQAVTAKGEKIELSKKEAMLLKLLIENKNDVVPREKILQSVWGYNVYPTTRTIDNFILNFRKYFEEDSRNPKYFHSVRGVGYKYAEWSPCPQDICEWSMVNSEFGMAFKQGSIHTQWVAVRQIVALSLSKGCSAGLFAFALDKYLTNHSFH